MLLEGEEPFVEEQLEVKARDEVIGVGKLGQLLQIGEEQCVEVGAFFRGQLQHVFGHRARGGEGFIVAAQVEEAVDERGVFQGVELAPLFEVDPFGEAKGGVRGFGHQTHQPFFEG